MIKSERSGEKLVSEEDSGYRFYLTFIVDLSVVVFVAREELLDFVFRELLAQSRKHVTQLGGVDGSVSFLIENAETLARGL